MTQATGGAKLKGAYAAKLMIAMDKRRIDRKPAGPAGAALPAGRRWQTIEAPALVGGLHVAR